MIYRCVLVTFFLILNIFPVIAEVLTSSVTIVVESLPSNTLDTDSIYVCGTFNDWKIKDENFLLHRRMDGKLIVNVPYVFDTLEYKFSRGEWNKIETDAFNEFLKNRKLIRSQDSVVFVSIQKWQDLGGQGSYSPSIFILSASVINGLLLLLVILRIKDLDKIKGRNMILWSLFIMTIATGSLFYYFSNFIWKLRLFLLFQFLLVCAGPLFYALLRSQTIRFKKKILIQFIPAAIVALLAFLRWNNVTLPYWMEREISSGMFLIDYIVILSGVILFVCYVLVGFIISQRKIDHASDVSDFSDFLFGKVDLENNLNFKTNVTEKAIERDSFRKMHNLLMSFNVFVFVLLLIGLLGFRYEDYLEKKIWINLLSISSLQLFIMFYFVWVYPNIFGVESPTEISTIGHADMELLERIKEIMIVEKPFKDPELSISDFAAMVRNKPHIVSKLINDIFQRNFRDFINEFRVREFIKNANSNQNKNYTFLYMAHEVGFNSKSTFNLAFKKITGISPREYFKKSTLD